MRHRFLIALAAILLPLISAYLVDYAVLRYKAEKNGAFGSVTVSTFYRVKQKNGRYEFYSSDPVNEECVHAIFPHMRDRPCWYAMRHTNVEIDIDSGNPNNPHLF